MIRRVGTIVLQVSSEKEADGFEMAGCYCDSYADTCATFRFVETDPSNGAAAMQIRKHSAPMRACITKDQQVNVR